TVSEFSRDDIAATYGIPADRIDILYNGSPEGAAPLLPEEAEQVRREVSGGAPYFYFVGTQQPRKNIANLFRAFDRFSERNGQGIKLLMAGRKKWWDAEITDTWEKMAHKERVVFAGRIEDDRLARIAG